MTHKKLGLDNYDFYLILIYFFWVLSIISYFFLNEFVKAGNLINGVKLGNDSVFYLREAQNILNGEASIFKYKSKFGYLLFLLPFLYFKLPLILVVFFQILLTGFSAWCLYRISSKYFCKLSGIISIFLFLFYFPIQIRNFYILTEILFIDLLIILTYLLVFFRKNFFPLIVFLIFALVSVRQNGILYLFSILICIFIYFIKYKKYLYLSLYLLILFLAIIPIVNLLNMYMLEANLIKMITNRGIIWGWSFEHNQICGNNGISCLEIQFINNNYQNTIFGFLAFLSENYFNFFKIFVLKIFWLLARVRPYYSDLHNSYILFFNLISYPAFIYGFLKRPRNNFSLNVIIFFMVFSLLLVGLTFADWSGRFSLYFLPLIFIFSSYGILLFVKNFFKIVRGHN